MSTILYSVINVASGKVTNQWYSTFAGVDYYEPNFGLPQRTLTANESGVVLDVDGSVPDLTKAISTGTVVDGNGVTLNTYVMPAQYTVTSTDVTAAIAQETAVQKGLAAQQFGAQLIAQVYAYNEANLASGALTSAQFTSMLADTTISTIERLLWNGSLATALALIESYNSTLATYFSSTQLSAVQSSLTAYLASN